MENFYFNPDSKEMLRWREIIVTDLLPSWANVGLSAHPSIARKWNNKTIKFSTIVAFLIEENDLSIIDKKHCNNILAKINTIDKILGANEVKVPQIIRFEDELDYSKLYMELNKKYAGISISKSSYNKYLSLLDKMQEIENLWQELLSIFKNYNLTPLSPALQCRIKNKDVNIFINQLAVNSTSMLEIKSDSNFNTFSKKEAVPQKDLLSFKSIIDKNVFKKHATPTLQSLAMIAANKIHGFKNILNPNCYLIIPNAFLTDFELPASLLAIDNLNYLPLYNLRNALVLKIKNGKPMELSYENTTNTKKEDLSALNVALEKFNIEAVLPVPVKHILKKKNHKL